MLKRMCETKIHSQHFALQFISDIHLEYYNEMSFGKILRPKAPYLALAGDIGKPKTKLFADFFKYCSNNWKHIFYVAGNHEYYGNKFAMVEDEIVQQESFDDIQTAISSVVGQFNNVHFFTEENPSVYLKEDNVAIVGQTLWTHIQPSKMKLVQKCMNDYSYISVNDQTKIRALSPLDINTMHLRQKAILTKQLAFWQQSNVPVCVITHHMPSFELICEQYRQSPINCCFASDCDELIQHPVRAWVYGHTHNVASKILNGVALAVNAMGYPKEHIAGFDTEAVIVISTDLNDTVDK